MTTTNSEPEAVPQVPDDVRNAALRTRYSALERELEAAPYHKVGTFWWDERKTEMSLIDRKLHR